MRILVIEDDSQTADYVAKGLRQAGQVVDVATNGPDGLFAAGEAYDVLVVDRMLPGIDGLSLVRKLRSLGVRTPTLFLTTMGGIDDRVEGLDAGADDYLVKPFAFTELSARINALARRPPLVEVETLLRVADLEMDLLKYRVTRAGREIQLQPQEFKLLEYLMRNAGRLTTRAMLLESVWGFHFDPKTSVVETHVSRLRSKINGDDRPDLIHTVRCAGYIMRAPDETV
ncbi:winged helix-turn-helix domain-containing protein [Labrys wisconsinensis]|uniref:Two-component system OmpR family response regulator n=1 Tax=Labrys wisconsinensis TaxID=425677 RepID=A0ABU0JK96_9HYPH|nr:response regulator transcription factor [Labrys wisconsinensis]MDQ0473684.1 two-component system OmpR family response regulator [Labrys wisconsinensis]